MTRPSENLSRPNGHHKHDYEVITQEGGTFMARSADNPHLLRIWEYVQGRIWVNDNMNPFTQHGIRRDHEDEIESKGQLYEEIRENLRRDVEAGAKQVREFRSPSKVESSRAPKAQLRRAGRTCVRAKFEIPLQPKVVDDSPPPRYNRYNKPELKMSS
ncbi:uncharacterized protein PV06_11829 [Exophiala oligosperma]|uniref:Uncharacterized protein n=1 Tax=Exophiala oligosperma TaxID=215243 RepID=A0A0D2D0S3_9EURO|nr:uncharacterized protein PV06_11829 [Exophiala oligosperma]KIW35845.1 hypothetical protein PV06_11829 [Exophiala oligosperma]